MHATMLSLIVDNSRSLQTCLTSNTFRMRRQVAIFYGAVLRGDLNKIRIGGSSVVLDRAVIHTAR